MNYLRRSVPNRPGFTLVELLIVIALIMVLAGMILAGAVGILRISKKKEIVRWNHEVAAALEDHRLDHGIYPLNPPGENAAGSATDELAILGSVVLYRHLSGDTDMDPDGRVDEPESSYLPNLAWQFQREGGSSPRSHPLSGGFGVLDPAGSPLRYLATPLNLDPAKKFTRNSTFDLWSVGIPPSPDDPSLWVTNWSE